MVADRGKHRKEKIKNQIENTIKNMNESQENMEHENIPAEEQRRIKHKNAHREDQIDALRDELDQD